MKTNEPRPTNGRCLLFSMAGVEYVEVLFHIRFRCEYSQSLGVSVCLGGEETLYSMRYCGDGSWYHLWSCPIVGEVLYRYALIDESVRIRSGELVAVSEEYTWRTVSIHREERFALFSFYGLVPFLYLTFLQHFQ